MTVVVPAMRRARLLSRTAGLVLASGVLVAVALAPTVASAKPTTAAKTATTAKTKPKSTASTAAPRTPRTAAATTTTAKAPAPSKNGSVAASTSKAAATKPAPKPAPACFHDAAMVQRGSEQSLFALTRCDGSPAPLAIERLSVLARPNAAAAPPTNIAALAKKATADLAPGVRRMDARLVARLQAVVDHFARGRGAGEKRASSEPRARIQVVSGYRPASVGSFHAHGRALDFRLDGVANEELVAFCKTLRDTGCGYYPNSSFVHLDVREPGTGHVQWIDGSGPGESPHYVSAWPPPPSTSRSSANALEAVNPVITLDPEAMPTAVDEHPSMPSTPMVGDVSEDEVDPTPASDPVDGAGEPSALPSFVAPENADGEGSSEMPSPLP